jgi:flavin reductase (DIM6/NTAB) family NADH-FMN oxidoreductase RutF
MNPLSNELITRLLISNRANQCGLTEAYLHDFPAPFVAESKVKIGMKFIEEVNVKANGTKLIIGEIHELIMPEDCLDDKGYVRLDRLYDVGIGGLNSYYNLKRIATFPYARVNELPDFSAKEWVKH